MRALSTRSRSVGGDLLALVLQELVGLVDERVGVVARLGLFLALAVFSRVLLGVVHHALDVVLGE